MNIRLLFWIFKFIIYLGSITSVIYLLVVKKNLLNLLNRNANKIKIFCLLCFQPPAHLPTPSSTSKPNTATFLTPLEIKAKVEAENSLDELKAQIVELLCVVEALKKDHG